MKFTSYQREPPWWIPFYNRPHCGRISSAIVHLLYRPIRTLIYLRPDKSYARGLTQCVLGRIELSGDFDESLSLYSLIVIKTALCI